MTNDVSIQILVWFEQLLESGRWLKLLLLLSGMSLLIIFWKVQQGENGVDFKELMVENGKASPTKIMQLGCFLITSWGFVVLVNNGTLTEWYFNGFILLWSGTRLATKWIDQKYGLIVPEKENQNAE